MSSDYARVSAFAGAGERKRSRHRDIGNRFCASGKRYSNPSCARISVASSPHQPTSAAILVEFYNLARSVKSAEKLNRGGTSSQSLVRAKLSKWARATASLTPNDQNSRAYRRLAVAIRLSEQRGLRHYTMEPRRELGTCASRIRWCAASGSTRYLIVG